jgi:hypothetical protein
MVDPTPLILQERPIRMIAAVELAQQFILALVELVISRRAHHVAVAIAPVPDRALLVSQHVVEHQCRFVAQQRGGKRTGTDVIARVNDDSAPFQSVHCGLEVGGKNRRAANRPAADEAASGNLSVEIIETQDLDANRGLERIGTQLPAFPFNRPGGGGAHFRLRACGFLRSMVMPRTGKTRDGQVQQSGGRRQQKPAHTEMTQHDRTPPKTMFGF